MPPAFAPSPWQSLSSCLCRFTSLDTPCRWRPTVCRPSVTQQMSPRLIQALVSELHSFSGMNNACGCKSVMCGYIVLHSCSALHPSIQERMGIRIVSTCWLLCILLLCVHVSAQVCIFISLRYMRRCGIGRTHDNSTFNLLKSCQTVFQSSEALGCLVQVSRRLGESGGATWGQEKEQNQREREREERASEVWGRRPGLPLPGCPLLSLKFICIFVLYVF